MSGLGHSGGEFIGEDLLTHSEISEWVLSRKAPARLRADFGCSGVYRYVSKNLGIRMGRTSNVTSESRRMLQFAFAGTSGQQRML